MNSCPDQRELAAFLKGELSESDSDQISAHFYSCLECQAAAKALTQIDDSLATDPSRTIANDHQRGDTSVDAINLIQQLGVDEVSSRTPPLTSQRPSSSTQAWNTSSVSIRPRQIQSATDAASRNSEGAPDDADYLTMQLIGEGGMGMVHLARQVTLGRVVAFKQIQLAERPRQSVRDRFLTEAVLTAKLEHPNIVPIYDMGKSPNGDLFYSMKNIKGRPWSDTIGSQSLEANLDILIDVCDAIAFAHAEGVIHRDLKPQNIMTGAFGEVLVLDWGLALMTDGNAEVKASVAGTPALMAPEMASPPFAVGPRSDVYLLGAILYMILTGKAPHRGKSGQDCLVSAAKNEIESPNLDHVREVDPSRELLGVAMRAMATEPENRFQTVTEFQQAIRDYVSHRESLKLSNRAQESLESAESSRDYGLYSRAVFGFEEAFMLWDQNVQASDGVARARIAWALCAEAQGDFDLSLSLLDDSVREQREIQDRVTEARNQRDAHKHHARKLRRLSVAAGVLLLMGATGFGVYQKRVTGKLAEQWDTILTKQRQTAEALKAESIQREKAEQQRSLAEQQRSLAEQQRSLAEQQRSLAEQHRETAEWQLYVNHIQSSHREWESNNPIAAAEYLARCREDLRGWEYRYLHALLARSHESLDGHTGLVTSVDISPAGNRLVIGSDNNTLTLWDAGSRKTMTGHEGAVTSVAFSPEDGDRIVSGSDDRTLKLWDAGTGEELWTRMRHSRSVTSVAFSRDGTRIVSGSEDMSMKLWDASTGEELWTRKGHLGWVRSVAFSPDGRRIVTGSEDRTLKLWDTATDEERSTLLGHTGSVRSVTFNLDGSRIVSASGDKSIKFWDTTTGKEKRIIRGHTRPVRSVALGQDGRIVSGSEDKTIKLWDADTGDEILTLKGHTDTVFSVAFSLDGTGIVSGGRDGKVKLWDADTGEEQALNFEGHIGPVLSVAFSPDGSRIVSGGEDRTVRQWDTNAGKQIPFFPFDGHSNGVTSVAFSSDGRRIASGSYDNTIKLWDAGTGNVVSTLIGHTQIVNSVAFSPDGSRIVSGGHDNTVKVWDVSAGKEILTLREHTDAVLSVAFSLDGSSIVSGGLDGTIRLRDATGEDALSRWQRTAAPEEPGNVENHQYRATLGEETNDWYAAAFHLGWLIAIDPDDTSLQQRRAIAESKLREMGSAMPPHR